MIFVFVVFGIRGTVSVFLLLIMVFEEREYIKPTITTVEAVYKYFLFILIIFIVVWLVLNIEFLDIGWISGASQTPTVLQKSSYGQMKLG